MKKPIPPKAEFYKTQASALLPPKAALDLPTLIQAVRESEALKEAERKRAKDEKLAAKAQKRTHADVIKEELVREAVTAEVERELKESGAIDGGQTK